MLVEVSTPISTATVFSFSGDFDNFSFTGDFGLLECDDSSSVGFTVDDIISYLNAVSHLL